MDFYLRMTILAVWAALATLCSITILRAVIE